MKLLQSRIMKAMLFSLALGMVAALVACSSNSSSSSNTVTITATSGGSQSAAVGVAFANPLTATVTQNGSPVSGATVTFAAPSSGASCTFTSATATTNSSGVATTNITANSVAGTYTVTATTTGASAPASFTGLSNTAASAMAYAFSLSGFDTDDGSPFYVAGVVTVNSSGAIVGGEQDYVDADNYGTQDLINPTGSSITTTADGNMQFVLATCFGSDCTQTDSVVGVAGVETINAALRPSDSTKGVITEFDGSGSATGTLRVQDPTAASTTPSMGYAFTVSGYDGDFNLLTMGGILNVDGAGTISGTGSIFDANDDGSSTTFQGETLQASTGMVSAPDAYGRVVFSITPTDTTDFPAINWVGYIADSSTIYLVETEDSYFGTTGGVALSQGANTGAFSASLSGTYGSAMAGFDDAGPLQLVNELTFNSGGTVTGVVDFNDLVTVEPASPDPVTASSYTADPTGRVTVTVTDASLTFSYNLQLYLDGNGDALAISMDTNDVLGSTLGGQINNSGVTDANFTGNYAMVATGWDGALNGDFSAVGPVTATGAGDTFAGFTDFNFYGVTTTDQTLSGGYTLLSPGLLSPDFITGLDVDSNFQSTDQFNMYEIDTSGDNVAIELDSNQLALGFIQQ